MKEVWKSIKGYEGVYEVSNLGRVKSLSRRRKAGTGSYLQKEKIMSLNLDKGGYQFVTFCHDYKFKTFKVHRLVLTAFKSNELNKPCVNHKNSIRHDNRLINLEWCTHKENVNYALENGNMLYGEKHHNSTISDDEVREIRELDGKIPRKEIAKMFGTKVSYVAGLCNGRKRKKTI